MNANSTRTRIVRSGLIVAALAASGAFLSTAPAGAGPTNNPLLTSTCTFTQVDEAAHAVAPGWAAQLDRYPNAKAQLKVVYDLPPRDRAAAVQRYAKNNPRIAAQILSSMNDQRAAE